MAPFPISHVTEKYLCVHSLENICVFNFAEKIEDIIVGSCGGSRVVLHTETHSPSHRRFYLVILGGLFKYCLLSASSTSLRFVRGRFFVAFEMLVLAEIPLWRPAARSIISALLSQSSGITEVLVKKSIIRTRFTYTQGYSLLYETAATFTATNVMSYCRNDICYSNFSAEEADNSWNMLSKMCFKSLHALFRCQYVHRFYIFTCYIIRSATRWRKT